MYTLNYEMSLRGATPSLSRRSGAAISVNINRDCFVIPLCSIPRNDKNKAFRNSRCIHCKENEIKESREEIDIFENAETSRIIEHDSISDYTVKGEKLLRGRYSTPWKNIHPQSQDTYGYRKHLGGLCSKCLENKEAKLLLKENRIEFDE